MVLECCTYRWFVELSSGSIERRVITSTSRAAAWQRRRQGVRATGRPPQCYLNVGQGVSFRVRNHITRPRWPTSGAGPRTPYFLNFSSYGGSNAYRMLERSTKCNQGIKFSKCYTIYFFSLREREREIPRHRSATLRHLRLTFEMRLRRDNTSKLNGKQ